MANAREDDKLELFQREILKKAQAQREKILAESQAAKDRALEAEKDRLLEQIFRRMQAEIATLKTDHVKQVSQQAQQLKRQLYAQREGYLSQMVADAQERLAAFTQTPAYAQWLLGQVDRMAAECPWEGSVIRVRPQDLPLADQIKAHFGRACQVQAEGAAITGGAQLENREHGVLLDLTFDAALAEERDRLHQLPELRMEEVEAVGKGD